jgi:hypothetical protein
MGQEYVFVESAMGSLWLGERLVRFAYAPGTVTPGSEDEAFVLEWCRAHRMCALAVEEA